ncbi:class I adenylate-forming enzyme family protein [Mycolicibacterium aubagnense]|uniref:O-succinylbenzoate--CoA ligase n=1 Tax=Mycolicibacterium aubagnense TaxID=319707 RepID=A0ABM7IA99_9MYCO|nr:AMP-binding protein [Mycolicibacterium aubagnense]TLH59564.1 AMP-dependent synthetase [Mycolicibacterium aubagnense]WGI34592.1 AMP-binding protein [Mycolicibacterium aubagnense]BBX83528.1 o-succinylbenzoate--CoA ligase [Mycolicibacterium aubagnense]
MTHPLSTRITEVLQLDPAANAIEYQRQWYSWRQLADTAETVAGISPGGQIGMLLRNRPDHVGALLGVLMSGGTVVTINPARGDERIRADLAALDLSTVIGDPGDLDAQPAASLGGLRVWAGNGTAETLPSVAVRMLTSGTTGPPKRIDLTYDMLSRSLMGPAPTALRRGVAIVNAPMVHIGGVFRVLQCITSGRSFALLDRFDLDRWADAVRRHRPAAVSLVPAALRAVLHSDLGADDLASIRAVTSGTAPLSPDDADAFTAKFGIPVLTSYAATEFGGGVAGWTIDDYHRFWKAKRGSVGRATLGALLRVVDDRGNPLTPGEPGLLEVKPGQLGPSTDWMRTTDLARIDADGFVWILGRADQAIIRGGFKVLPDDVRAAIEGHPAVAGAAVVGSPDERLGETPVAMVELRAPAEVDDIVDYLRTRLARYEIPSAITIVQQIPRTPSGKADLSEVHRFFAEQHAE